MSKKVHLNIQKFVWKCIREEQCRNYSSLEGVNTFGNSEFCLPVWKEGILQVQREGGSEGSRMGVYKEVYFEAVWKFKRMEGRKQGRKDTMTKSKKQKKKSLIRNIKIKSCLSDAAFGREEHIDDVCRY